MAVQARPSAALILQFALLLNLAVAIELEDIINENGVEEETTLTADDFARAPEEEIDLTLLGIKMRSDPTMGKMAEGDIAVTNLNAFNDQSSRLERSAVRQFYRRWPSGEVPYAISSRYGPYSRSVIAKAMQKFHDISCVRFVPRVREQHSDYLYITPHDGCYSLVGRAGGSQPVSLEADCIQSGTIIHELMHAIGFFHEQSRPDRDEFIEIVWENVMRGAEDQFDKHSLRYLDLLNEPYDYASIMHYGPYAFSGNGRRTIIALKRGGEKMGQRKSLSDIDIRKINKLYSCQEKLSPETVDRSSDEDFAKVTRPTIPLKPTSDCTDKSWRCILWSLSIFDYCSNSEKIAVDLCPKSCGTCSDQLMNKNRRAKKITTTAKHGIEPITLGFLSELPTDTNTEKGLVTKTIPATATTPSTTVSTGTSERTTTNCRDLNQSCPMLVRIIGCDDFFPNYSLGNMCPLSCGLCSLTNTGNNNKSNKTPKGAIKKCEDRESYMTCKLVLFFNECGEKVNLCAKTCGAC